MAFASLNGRCQAAAALQHVRTVLGQKFECKERFRAKEALFEPLLTIFARRQSNIYLLLIYRNLYQDFFLD